MESAEFWRNYFQSDHNKKKKIMAKVEGYDNNRPFSLEYYFDSFVSIHP